MRKLILQFTSIIAFAVSIIWFLNEPGFEPFLAFLTGIAVLVESGKEVHLPTDPSEEIDVDENLSENRQGNQSNNVRQTRELKIADVLYKGAFAHLRSNISHLIVLIACPPLLTGLVIMLNLSDAILILSWLVPILLIYFRFTRTINNLYKQISISGFYSDLSSISHREKVKDMLLSKQWGGKSATGFMRLLIQWLLITDKRKVNRFLNKFG